MTDAHDLQRFISAQAPVYDHVVAELSAGLKRSHWMWFIFPQLRGLGRSPMAERYGIASRAEAAAYGAHPLLGARLIECTCLMLAAPNKTALQILGSPDDLKFKSCMTLFGRVLTDADLFKQALEHYFAGAEDERTVAML